MEITLEKIELVKDRTGVTYKEAKEALEAADGNVVDAIISIEDTIDEQTSTKKIGKQSEALVDKMKEIVKRGNVTRIIIRKDGEKFLNVPVNAGVLGAVIAPWGMIAAALVALGTKCEIELLKKDGTTIDLSGKAENLAGSAKETGSRFYEEFKEHKIRFLCACDMISEGWDYPELGILVMARPTLSKVLYLQQIGRGLRRTSIKKNVFVIDVVDEYGAMVRPCSMHAIFGNSLYVPFGDITRQDYLPGQMIEIDGITERVERIVEVDIHTFEEKYGDYYSQEQLAREYFVNTGTITSWIRKGKITPTVEFPFGSKKISLFSPEDVEKYRKELNIQEHNDDTVRDDFFAFLEERDYSLSYKMPFLLSFIDHMDTIGDAKIEDVLTDYIAFYQDRIDKGLPVDRPSCPYNAETLKDRKMIKSSMLTNPFEKFERKRLMYYSQDLGVISLNHALLAKMSEGDWERVTRQMREDLERYYKMIKIL